MLWCQCYIKVGYLYEFNLCFDKKKTTELALGGTVTLYKKLENTHCMLYFDNFFKSLTLVEKLFDRGIYCLGRVRSDQKNMAIMKKDEDIKNGDMDVQYVNDVVAMKQFDNRGVTMDSTCFGDCKKVSTVTHRLKWQSTKIPISCKTL